MQLLWKEKVLLCYWYWLQYLSNNSTVHYCIFRWCLIKFFHTLVLAKKPYLIQTVGLALAHTYVLLLNLKPVLSQFKLLLDTLKTKLFLTVNIVYRDICKKIIAFIEVLLFYYHTALFGASLGGPHYMRSRVKSVFLLAWLLVFVQIHYVVTV